MLFLKSSSVVFHICIYFLVNINNFAVEEDSISLVRISLWVFFFFFLIVGPESCRAGLGSNFLDMLKGMIQ